MDLEIEEGDAVAGIDDLEGATDVATCASDLAIENSNAVAGINDPEGAADNSAPCAAGGDALAAPVLRRSPDGGGGGPPPEDAGADAVAAEEARGGPEGGRVRGDDSPTGDPTTATAGNGELIQHTELNDHDVLVKRGSDAGAPSAPGACTAGNRRFRHLCAARKAEYRALAVDGDGDRHQKRICRAIVAAVRAQGGRFVHCAGRDAETGRDVFVLAAEAHVLGRVQVRQGNVVVGWPTAVWLWLWLWDYGILRKSGDPTTIIFLLVFMGSPAMNVVT